ncbi:MAG: beta-lactamase family protein [Spirochaetes bacterium]|jgi:CubicO group peptidase (beta-lactamase class C family)|nr:beta-lactamase family protein [Spirochaetota bacterium]
MKLRKIFLYVILVMALLSAIRVLTLSSDERIYLKRFFLWNVSDIDDHKKFPSIEIKNEPPVFHFKKSGVPMDVGAIEYTVKGEKKSADIAELNRRHNSTAFIVIKDDVILYEEYFNGYSRDSINTSFSTAKSFSSALVGIALAEGKLGNLADPVVKYLPELKERGLDGLTLRHLLVMGSGIRYEAGRLLGMQVDLPGSDMPRVYYHPDLRSLALAVSPGDQAVGEHFYYNDYHPVLMGIILERTVGSNAARYLEEKIWKKIGMEYPASWSVDSERNGTVKMESGINARAIDFARFGRLYLNGGKWNGRQVVPKKWVIESTAPDPSDRREWLNHQKYREYGAFYKYWWWGVHRAHGRYDSMAIGHLGQYIFIRPDKKIIIVRNGIDRGGVDWWPEIFQRVADRL